MRPLNPKTWLAATVTFSVLVLISAASPSTAEAARVHTASSNPQSSIADAASCPVYTYEWYMETASGYAVMMDTSNFTWLGVHTLQRFGNVIWNFCRTGTNGGDPVFHLVDEGTYGVVGDCAADTGPTWESGEVAYFELKSCTASGTDFIERPLSNGQGFRLESLYQLNSTGRAEYITVHSATNDYRLFLAENGTGAGPNVWNGSPCASSVNC